MDTEKKIAHKAAKITQNKLYALAASLYGIGIILLLSASETFTAGHPMPWLVLLVGMVSLVAGEKVARKGESLRK